MRASRKYFLLATVVLLLIVAEWFSRAYLGFGTPALSTSHPTIEYLYQPNQEVYRFHNRILINQYGMRSEPFTQQKQDPSFRVMVFGDSVVNGGNRIDHNELATTILQQKLARILEKKVVVGNISAGSWGPGNWLAYLKEYGTFDADVIVLVVSSHDYFDNPTYEPLDAYTHPQKAPVFALGEGITRYLPVVLGVRSPPDWDLSDASKAKGLSDIKQFLEQAKESVSTVVVFQHWGKAEILRDKPYLGNLRVRELCDSIGIPTVSLRPYFQTALENGESPYTDDIHPSERGQTLLAQALFDYIDVHRGD